MSIMTRPHVPKMSDILIVHVIPPRRCHTCRFEEPKITNTTQPMKDMNAVT